MPALDPFAGARRFYPPLPGGDSLVKEGLKDKWMRRRMDAPSRRSASPGLRRKPQVPSQGCEGWTSRGAGAQREGHRTRRLGEALDGLPRSIMGALPLEG